jgi:uncharacterized damage-inducible protein DinB
MQLSPEQAQGMATFMIAGFENEIPTTAKVLAAVPQDKLDFTLGDKGRTVKDLMWHIITSDIWFTNGISAGEFAQGDSKPGPDSVKEMVSQYESGMRAGMDKLKAMKGEDLAKPVNFFNVMNFPAVMYVGFLNNHCIHHRGQLSTYLRAMNAHVPSIYGGSADEPFQPPAK